MKKTVYFVWLLVGAQSGLASQLTLDMAKDYAVKINPEVVGLVHEVEAAKLNFEAASGNYYPELGSVGGFQNQSASGISQSTALAYLYLNLNLFRGGRDSANRNLMKSQLKKTEIRLEKAKLRVRLDVEEAFHLYLYQKEKLGHQESALERNRNLLKMAKTRLNRGLVPKSDVMEFEITDSLLKSEVVSVKQELAEARVILKKYLGPKIGTNVEPAGKLQHRHLLGTLSDYTSKIETETESVLLERENLLVAEHQRSIARADYFPTVGLEAHAGYEPLDERPPGGGATIDGMIKAEWKFFSGFETKRKMAAANATKRTAEAKLKAAIIEALAGIEVAYRRLLAIQERVDLESKNKENARKLYREVISEYKRGVKSSGDVKGAADSLFQASLIESKYKFDFLKEKIAMARALGTEVDTEVITEKH